MRDIAPNIGVVLALSPAVQSATINGLAVDTNGFEAVAFALNTGAIASAGDFTAKVQESDTTTSGDFTDAAAAVVTSSAPATLTADGSFKLGYRGFKRYVRLVLTKNSGTSIAAGAVAILGRAHNRPVA